MKQAVRALEPPAIAAGDEAAIDPPIHYGRPLLVDLLLPHIRPDFAADANPLRTHYMAGWVGLLVTGCNMLPISQLNGGHVVHGLLGRKGHWFSRILYCWPAGDDGGAGAGDVATGTQIPGGRANLALVAYCWGAVGID